MVTASAMTTSNESPAKGSAQISPGRMVTRPPVLAARTLAPARSSMSGAMSTAVTWAPKRPAISTAVVATPQPTSSTRLAAVMRARASSACVDARPPGWMTLSRWWP
jgi:hypothetical protein